ncbi:MAG: tRNA pseudouridine(38-40) synthase TruA [Ignavibacteria bacterium]|nr:tRNA pseudouridine(38-40) synthase TruA [Ignavibacteria bacterium]
MRFKLIIEYAGTNYSGWQKQSGGKSVKTVQETLVKAIKKVFSETKAKSQFIDLQASGRTDAGVHALGQVAHLDCRTMLAPEILKMKINDALPSDINILEVEKTDLKFHARHSAKSRQYLYVISKRRTAIEKKFVWWIKDKLNVKRMKESVRLFEGMHDFRNFADRLPEDKSTKCLIEKTEITEDKDKIYIRIRASHFLWKMVRRIVGTLVEAGRGNVNEDTIMKLLRGEETHFKPSFYTAPPSGLFLEKVYY